MSKLLAYTIGGQKIGIDIKTWNTIMLSGNTAFMVIADTGSTPSNYTNISSVDNWNSFGNSAGLTDIQVKTEIIKLIPNIPTADQYAILANYMNVGINTMTKIGTSVSLGNIVTGSTYLTGVKDIKLNVTGSTATGNTTINGNIISKVVSGSTSVISPNICATTSFYEGGTALSSKYASKANAITGATNLGGGNGTLYTSVSGNKINLKSLSGGTNVTLTCNGNYIAINTTSGGGGITWTGSTANGVGTYASSTKICSNPNMTFNGTALSITGNINASTYVCSPIITGSTRICSPIVCGTSCITSLVACGTTCSASPLHCGACVYATSIVCSPIITGSTRICSPIVCGTSCIASPITCGTTCAISPITIGSTCMCSPIVLGSTCACSPVIIGSTCSSSPLHCGACMYATSIVCSPIITGSTRVCSPIVCGTSCIQSPITCGTTCAISPITIGSTCVCSPVGLFSTSSCSPIHCGACGYFSTAVCSPVITGSTKVCSPIVCGTSCITSPITCGTTCMITPIVLASSYVCSPIITGSTRICSPIVCGTSCVTSPTICSSTCLCSTGTARFTGNVTAASCLNVSGATRIVGITQCEIVFGNPTTCALTGNTNFLYNATGCTLCVPYIRKTGSGSYFYTESTSTVTNATATCKVYLSGTPWNFQAGTYRVDINANVGNGSSNGCSLARITCNGLTSACSIAGCDFLLRSQTANFGFSVSVSRDLVFTAGCHCLIVSFWAGANTACVTYASIRAERIC